MGGGALETPIGIDLRVLGGKSPEWAAGYRAGWDPGCLDVEEAAYRAMVEYEGPEMLLLPWARGWVEGYKSRRSITE